MAHLSARLTIVGVHHTNKRQSSSVSNSLMGSNGIGSVLTTSLEISVDYDGKRYLRTMQRYGHQRERTELHFDRIRKVATLGESDGEKNANKKLFQVKDTQKRICEVVSGTPGIPQPQLLEKVPGKRQSVLKEIRQLESNGFLRSEGKGRRGDPVLYYPAEIPTECAA